MNSFLLKNKFKFLMFCIVFLSMQHDAFSQQWTYDFGTGTGSFTNTTASTAFLPTPTSGTSRVRTGTGGGAFVLANPGLAALGTDSELQFTSNTGSTSTSKFSVYDYIAGNKGYVKFKIAFNGGTNGVYNFSLGDGATFSDNNPMSSSQVFAGLRWSLTAGNTVTYNVLNAGTYGTTGISSPTTLFVQNTATTYEVEIYANNSTASTSYVRNSVSNSLPADSWDLWVDGVKVGTALASGQLANNATFDSFAFNHQVSATTPGTVYLDDIRYANLLPSNVAPTATAGISGTATVGQTLTGSHTYNDADGDLEGTSTYRWFRADNGSGLNEAAIPGETATTYLLAAADAGKFIRFGVTPVAATGTSPGTEVFSSYVGPVSTGNNSLSTITADLGFAPGSNVNYLSYLGTNVTGTSLEVAKFNLNDVAGTPDDGLSTTLTSLTFSVSGFGQFEKIALYDDTNTEIQEVTSAATITFSGLAITAASGSTKNFSVRATFKSIVTDNVQPQLIITAATANTNGSFFAAANAGGASSSVANDDNKIEVTATALQFVQDATNTNVGVNMTPAVTVKAIDTNLNTDADFNGSVAITSTGTLAAPQNANAVNGIATFSAINHTLQQNGVQLTAAASGLSNAVSALFNVTIQEAGVLLFEENFETAGLLTAQGYTSTSGAGTNNLTAGAAGLSYTNYGSTGIGNALAMATNGQDVSKTFTTQPSPAAVYLACVVNISSAGTGDYFLALAPAAGNTTYRGRLFVKASATPGFVNFGIANINTGTIYGTTNFALNTSHVVVLKYEFTAGASAVASVFVDPNLYGEPTASEISITDTTPANIPADLTSFTIRQGGAASAAVLTLDGIRIATNWGTALGNPQYTTTASINAGNYNTVNVISGTLTAAGAVTVNNAITVDGGADFEIPNNTNLIQKGTVNNNSGNITVKREAQMKRLDYVYWSSPVAGQNILDFSPLTITNRFYEINEVTNSFVALTTTDFVAAKGYVIRAPNTFNPNPNAAPETFFGSFNGVPNNGDISIPVSFSGASKGFNLIGNPYPSTIDANAFLAANTSVSTLYFWAHVNQNAASGANYATYNGVGTAAATGGQTPNGTIQTGQGFLAKVTASGTVNFTNALRVNNTAGQFFRNAIAEKNRFWLNLSENNNQKNQVLVGYVTDATNGLDSQFDAQLIETAGSKLYNLIDNSAFVIQGRALPFVNTDEVALGFKTEIAGNFTISMDHFDGLFADGQDIFVKDNLTGTIHNVKETPYTFASAAGTFDNRFSVVYQNTTLGIENPASEANNIVVFKQNNALNINSGATVMQRVKVYDISGRLIYTNNDVNASTTAISLNVAQQVLVVQITSTDNKTVSKKVVF